MRGLVWLSLLAYQVAGWVEGGHVLMAAIARQTLIDEGRSDVVEIVDRILAADDDAYIGVKNVISAAAWLHRLSQPAKDDKAIIDNFHAFDGINTLNMNYSTDCIGPYRRWRRFPYCFDVYDLIDNYLAEHSHETNLHTMLREVLDYLSFENPHQGRTWGLAMYIRLLLQLMADAHAPMQLMSMWWQGMMDCSLICGRPPTPEDFCSETGMCKPYVNPEGRHFYAFPIAEDNDHGRRVRVDPDAYTSNLWTEMEVLCGVEMHTSAADFPQKEREEKAREIIEFYPREKAAARKIDNDWTLNHHVYVDALQVALNGTREDGSYGNADPWWYIYREYRPPLELCPREIPRFDYCNWSYISQARKYCVSASKRLVALAGYRVADVLKRMVDNMPSHIYNSI